MQQPSPRHITAAGQRIPRANHSDRTAGRAAFLERQASPPLTNQKRTERKGVCAAGHSRTRRWQLNKGWGAHLIRLHCCSEEHDPGPKLAYGRPVSFRECLKAAATAQGDARCKHGWAVVHALVALIW